MFSLVIINRNTYNDTLSSVQYPSIIKLARNLIGVIAALLLYSLHYFSTICIPKDTILFDPHYKQANINFYLNNFLNSMVSTIQISNNKPQLTQVNEKTWPVGKNCPHSIALRSSQSNQQTEPPKPASPYRVIQHILGRPRPSGLATIAATPWYEGPNQPCMPKAGALTLSFRLSAMGSSDLL